MILNITGSCTSTLYLVHHIFSSPLIKEKLIKTSNMGHTMQMYDFKRLFFKSYNCLIILNSYPRSCNPNLTFLPILLYKGTCFLLCLNAKCCQHMEGKYHSVSHTHTLNPMPPGMPLYHPGKADNDSSN